MNDVTIRPITDADTDDIVRWRNNENVRKNFVYQEKFTPESHTQWLRTKVDTGKVAQFIIEADGKPIGSCYLRDISKQNRSAEFGIFIGEDTARRKGYGTTAGKKLLDYGFKQLGLHRIFLRVFSDNERAIRSYERIGFKKEGYFRDMIFQNGNYRSMIFMSCLNGEQE